MQILDPGRNEWETYREGQQWGSGEERERLRMPATGRSSEVRTGQVAAAGTVGTQIEAPCLSHRL